MKHKTFKNRGITDTLQTTNETKVSVAARGTGFAPIQLFPK